MTGHHEPQKGVKSDTQEGLVFFTLHATTVIATSTSKLVIKTIRTLPSNRNRDYIFYIKYTRLFNSNPSNTK